MRTTTLQIGKTRTLHAVHVFAICKNDNVRWSKAAVFGYTLGKLSPKFSWLLSTIFFHLEAFGINYYLPILNPRGFESMHNCGNFMKASCYKYFLSQMWVTRCVLPQKGVQIVAWLVFGPSLIELWKSINIKQLS